jgi:hypothetical protein
MTVGFGAVYNGAGHEESVGAMQKTSIERVRFHAEIPVLFEMGLSLDLPGHFIRVG